LTEITIKICSICGEEKKIVEFISDKRRPQGKGNQCQQCISVRNKRWYANNLDWVRQRAKNYKQKHKERIRSYRQQYYEEHRNESHNYYKNKMIEFTKKAVLFLGGKCEICGLEAEWHEIYDFHHTNPEDKEYQISWLRCKDWEKIVTPELLKCTLLCCNCHTYLRQQNARTKANRTKIQLYNDDKIDNHKKRCLGYLGTKCQICGLTTENHAKYAFHHVVPATKLYKISNIVGKDWETKVRPELDKCCVLCGNCHRSFHYGRYENLQLKAGPI
jgi:hypothetical protein